MGIKCRSYIIVDAKFNSYIKKRNNNLEVTLWETSVVPLNEPHGRLPRQGSSPRGREGDGGRVGAGVWEETVTPSDK